MGDGYLRLLDSINRARRSKYRLNLIWSVELERSALDWSLDLASLEKLDHGDFASRISKALPDLKEYAENISMGQANSDVVVSAWMSDKSHRKNLLGNYNVCGGAMSRDRNGVPYWVLDLARV